MSGVGCITHGCYEQHYGGGEILALMWWGRKSKTTTVGCCFNMQPTLQSEGLLAQLRIPALQVRHQSFPQETLAHGYQVRSRPQAAE